MAVGLIYVVLSSDELAIARVALRRSSGGHDVPEDRIRRTRSIANLAWFARHADTVYVYCNDPPAPEPPILIASKQEGRLQLHRPGVVPELDEALKPLL